MTFKQASISWLAGLLLACAAIGAGMLVPIVACAQAGETSYFQETGHNVSGEFLRFYEANGGRAILGYPLTREFEEKGRRVQYFQRARLELYFESSESQRVQLGVLGRELGYAQPPLSAAEVVSLNHPDRRYYPETGHTVAFAFLEFYEAHGGPALFGYPISEWVIEVNGRIVQYFERIKLEWYPENPPGQRVQPGMLGVIYVAQHVDPIYTEREDLRSVSMPATAAPDAPSDPGSLPSTVMDLRLLASVKHPIIGAQDRQTVYVYVLDQAEQGVEGSSVEVEVQYPSGAVDRLAIDETNGNGYGWVEFSMNDPAPGQAMLVRLRARYAGLEASTYCAFLPWW